MANIDTSAQTLNSEAQVKEPPPAPKKPWQWWGPLLAALLRVGWEIIRDLVLKK